MHVESQHTALEVPHVDVAHNITINTYHIRDLRIRTSPQPDESKGPPPAAKKALEHTTQSHQQHAPPQKPCNLLFDGVIVVATQTAHPCSLVCNPAT